MVITKACVEVNVSSVDVAFRFFSEVLGIESKKTECNSEYVMQISPSLHLCLKESSDTINQDVTLNLFVSDFERVITSVDGCDIICDNLKSRKILYNPVKGLKVIIFEYPLSSVLTDES